MTSGIVYQVPWIKLKYNHIMNMNMKSVGVNGKSD